MTSNQSNLQIKQHKAPPYNWILETYLRQADNTVQEIDRTMSAWKMDKSVEGGRRTAAALETLQAEIIVKMTDIDETWEEIEANSEGI